MNQKETLVGSWIYGPLIWAIKRDLIWGQFHNGKSERGGIGKGEKMQSILELLLSQLTNANNQSNST